MRDAYWRYVSNIFMFENYSFVPDSPKHEIKKFWSFVMPIDSLQLELISHVK